MVHDRFLHNIICRSIFCCAEKRTSQGLWSLHIFVDLEQAEQSSKNTATGLMRALIQVWYSKERLAACSAISGINLTIRTAVFSKCILPDEGC